MKNSDATEMQLQKVSLRQAFLLKEAGFDVPTYAYYPAMPQNTEDIGFFSKVRHSMDSKCCNNTLTEGAAAPTLSLALKWLRERHRFFILPHVAAGVFTAYITGPACFEIIPLYGVSTVEEVESFGLDYVLVQLLKHKGKNG